jgi:hypothetical protein
MALLISDAVICGQIDNRTRNSVKGWIRLRGMDRPVIIDLTGNCADDLAGCCIHFHAVELPAKVNPTDCDPSRLASRQIGPVGTMTTRGKVQIVNCSTDEVFHRGHADDANPSFCRQSLFLEWYSQNGHIIVELLEATVRRVHIPLVPLLDEPDPWDLLDAGDETFDDPAEDADEDADEDEEEVVVDEDEDEDEEEEDPFGLFPEDLEDRLACGLSREDGGLDPFSDEELDSLSDDASTEIPLRMLFDPPLKLYPAVQLSDSQLEESLQVLLACLARHGVALRMCEHFTARQAYCLLLDRILPEGSIPAALVDSGGVQHYATRDFCPNCLDPFQRDE